MQIYFFTIPIQLVSEQNEELNNLLKSKKIVQIEKHLVTLAGVTGASALPVRS